MAWFGPKLEPGERVVLRHWPERFVYGLGALIAAMDVGSLFAVDRYVARSGAPGGQELMLFAIGAVVLSLALLPLMVWFLRLAVVTDRRLLVRNEMSWSNSRQIRLHEIEDAYQEDGRFHIRGAGRTLEFPCLPGLARPLLKALSREPEVGLP